MTRYVAGNGPIVVSVNAALLQLYVGGVLHPTRSNCDPNFLNHNVLLVGFGFDNNSSHWILKNSWGLNWGEKGYFRLHRGSNACGIASRPITAVIPDYKPRIYCPQ
ncbi:cathepsin W-like [Ornithorhynchus anatinus]|uniref:cathepsin W-like n=1 Tax=Ornithorhynchus anatinus TaxID=9258 RepID=UPI0019D41248|nr:cathepsin W-like [Ornithorhynchus anatinus]